MKKLLVLLVLASTSGCWHSRSAGNEVEDFIQLQSEWNEWMRTHHYYVDESGIHPEYVQKLRVALDKVCKAAGLSDAECDALDPGPGDTTETPPANKPPKWGE